MNEGYAAFHEIQLDFQSKRTARTFDDKLDPHAYATRLDDWADRVIDELDAVFRSNSRHSPSQIRRLTRDGAERHLQLRDREGTLPGIRGLDQIRTVSVDEYTDLPLTMRLNVEDIDSFQQVRDVNPASVSDLLKDCSFDRSEVSVQMVLEQVLAVPMHKKDWGGETNDLYTANVLINGARHETAFVLKGNGLKKKTMEIRDCGATGDQLLRLLDARAKLFVVQFVGNISEAVIKDMAGKIEHLRSLGREAWYLIMDGQDTARVLRAYGKACTVVGLIHSRGRTTRGGFDAKDGCKQSRAKRARRQRQRSTAAR